MVALTDRGTDTVRMLLPKPECHFSPPSVFLRTTGLPTLRLTWAYMYMYIVWDTSEPLTQFALLSRSAGAHSSKHGCPCKQSVATMQLRQLTACLVSGRPLLCNEVDFSTKSTKLPWTTTRELKRYSEEMTDMHVSNV